MACRVGQLVARQSALFVCDMQEKFRPAIKYFDEIAQVAARLLQSAKMLEMPVVVTEQNPSRLGSTVSEIGLANYPDLKPIPKTQFSMLTPEVVQLMGEKYPSVKSVILCGIEAHVCVQGTALALMEKGYDVHVVLDACSSRTMTDRMVAFQRMRSTGCWLTTSEAAILGLVGDAAHPLFKQIQGIIKTPAPDTGLLSYVSQPVSI